MPTELKKLTLTELSLVDRPANPLAMAPIFKADSNGEEMTEQVEKMSEEMDKKIKDYMKAKGCDRKTAEAALMKSFDEVETLKADMEKLKADNETLRKGILGEGYKITKEGIEKKAPEEFVEIEGEQILKSDIPAPILKRLEEAEVEKAEAAVAKKAQEELPNFDQEVAKALVKADLSEDVMKALKAADALFDGMTEEVGKSGVSGDMADPNEQIKKYAQEKGIAEHEAYAELAKTAEGRALISKVYEAKKDA